MLDKWWIIASAVALGVVLTLGSLKVFATKGEVLEIAMYDKCGQVQFEIYKIQSEIRQIQNWYRRPDGSIGPMRPNDGARVQQLLKFLQKWEEYQKQLRCVPGKAW